MCLEKNKAFDHGDACSLCFPLGNVVSMKLVLIFQCHVSLCDVFIEGCSRSFVTHSFMKLETRISFCARSLNLCF